MDALLNNLANKTGVDKSTAKEMLGTGAITADEGIFAMMQVIRDRVSRGDLGTASLAQGTSISGLLSTIESFPEKLFYSVKLDSAGVMGVKNFLGNLVATFNRLTGDGGKLTTTLQRVVDTVGSFLGQADRFGQVSMGNFVDRMIDSVSTLYDMLKGDLKEALETFNLVTGNSSLTFEGSVKTLNTALRVTMNSLATIAGLVVTISEKIEMITGDRQSPAAERASNMWKKLNAPLFAKDRHEQFLQHNAAYQAAIGGQGGMSIATGFAGGIEDGMALVSRASDALANTRISSTAAALQSHSPSRVFAQLGSYAAQGFAQGIDGGQDLVAGSIAGMLGSPGASLGAVAGARATRQLPAVELHVHVDGRGDDVEALAAKLRELLPDELNKVFLRLAVEMGEI